MFQVLLYGIAFLGLLYLFDINWKCLVGNHSNVYKYKYTIVTRGGTTTRKVYRCRVCGEDKRIEGSDFSYTYDN